jgi:ATP-dependent helicase/nuclease subunit B
LASSEGSAGARGPRAFFIPLFRPFADDLAEGLLGQSADPLDLARTWVLLPGRRAARTLADAFVRRSEGRALLLPRLVPVGDLEDDPASLVDGLDPGPPEIEPLARRVALARLLAANRGLAAPQALAHAAELAAALDTLAIEGVPAAALADALPGADLEGHWRHNAEVLRLLWQAWPAVLAERGRADPALRRNRLLDELAARWAQAPPAHAVVMAGFSAAPPAVARLAGTVARLPRGCLILSGFEAGLDAGDRARIAKTEIHIGHAVARLLEGARIAPGEVRSWPHRAPELAGSSPARAEKVARALAPAGFAAPRAPAPLEGVRMVEAATVGEEALVIAIAMRQVVKRPGTTAALVTPDRALARRVAVQLGRFGIDLDDSAGEPLAATLPGSLFLAIAEAAAERFAPVALLALLQHPLVAAGDGRLGWLNRVRELDRRGLRGLRPAPGLGGVTARLGPPGPLRDWWVETVTPMLAPAEAPLTHAAAVVAAVREVAGTLAGPALWEHEAGRALAQLLDGLDGARADLVGLPLEPPHWPALLAGLMADVTVRPAWRRHPQLMILGPLEARLQQADLMIAAGLDEGVWPGVPAPDPFLPPALRRALGLPGPAVRTGLAGLDLAGVLGAREVLLTRSLSRRSAPAVASRFWQRLVAANGGLADTGALSPSRAALLAAARGLDRPQIPILLPRPEPAPQPAARPRTIRVTDVAQLRADPFSFYARRILKLEPLDPLDADPTAGDRGSAAHRILERWLAAPSLRPEDIAGLVDAELARLGDRPDLAALWRPRVLRAVEWAVGEIARDDGWAPIAAEAEGRLERQGIALVGRADRVDEGEEGFRITDYKTGSLPRVADVEALWDCQLALLAAMAEAGAMEGVPAGPVVALDYWRLGGGRKPGEARPALGRSRDAARLAAYKAAALAEFDQLARAFLLGSRPFTAKLHQVHGRRFRTYDLLARVAEWRR